MKSTGVSHKFATLKDVAERAGTSAATVSFVLNDAENRYISKEMRERVEQAAAELNYLKSGAASSLKGKKTGVIAVLSPQYENHYFASIFAAIERVAHERSCVLATLNTFDDPVREKYALNQMVCLRADGFLVIPTIGGGENTAYIRSRNVPFVALERPLTGVEYGEYDFISSDNGGAIYTLTKHVLERGHKRIALAYWKSQVSDNISNLRDRREGYINALSEYGVYDPNLIFEGDITRADGARITERILSDKTVTAIVYAHYILAEGGIKYMREKAVRVPDDISVTFLGAPTWTDMIETDFTHIIQPGSRVGLEAAETLLNRIDGGKEQPVIRMIPGVLHEGKSVSVL